MDPYAMLGLDPDASADEVRRVYHALARRHHPDRAGHGSADLMASINAAYEIVTGSDGERRGSLPGKGSGEQHQQHNGRPPGWWLEPGVRAVLAPELLAVIDEREQVLEVALVTVAGGDGQLAVTARRLLWLSCDAVLGRVRTLRLADVTVVRCREPGRLRRGSQLEVRALGGVRVRFSGLGPAASRSVAARIQSHAVRTLV